MIKKKSEQKPASKESLITAIRGKKKDLQQARFRFSPEVQRRTAKRRMLRRDIARTATALKALRRDTGGKDTSRVT